MNTEENLKQIEKALRSWHTHTYPSLQLTLESLASLRESFAAKDRQIMDWESREASVCPEDVGIVEYVGVLQKRIAEIEKSPSRIRLATMEKERDEAEYVARVMTEEARLLRQRIAALEKERDQALKRVEGLHLCASWAGQQVAALEAAAKEHQDVCPMLSARESAILADLIENPPEPNERLRAAARAALSPTEPTSEYHDPAYAAKLMEDSRRIREGDVKP